MSYFESNCDFLCHQTKSENEHYPHLNYARQMCNNTYFVNIYHSSEIHTKTSFFGNVIREDNDNQGHKQNPKSTGDLVFLGIMALVTNCICPYLATA